MNRKADSNAKRNIGKEAKKLSKQLNLEDKIDCYTKRPAFFATKRTLKAVQNVV